MGRPAGSPNKSTGFIKDIAQRHGPDCIAEMVKLVKNPKVAPSDKKACAELVLAYGYGKPTQRSEFSGPEGGAIPVSVEGADEALAKLIKEAKGE
jgi:hypothetical protein